MLEQRSSTVTEEKPELFYLLINNNTCNERADR